MANVFIQHFKTFFFLKILTRFTFLTFFLIFRKGFNIYYLVVVKAGFVLKEAENLAFVFFAVVLAGQTKAELAVAVRKAVVGDAVEERIFLVDFFLLGQQLLVIDVVRQKHCD